MTIIVFLLDTGYTNDPKSSPVTWVAAAMDGDSDLVDEMG
jgi:hypothetical protein